MSLNLPHYFWAEGPLFLFSCLIPFSLSSNFKVIPSNFIFIWVSFKQQHKNFKTINLLSRLKSTFKYYLFIVLIYNNVIVNLQDLIVV